MTKEKSGPSWNERQHITALAATLDETAGELLKLIKRKQPELHQAMWLMRQANTKICEVFRNLERITEQKKT